ncbi:MAG TPA: VTT domain-containing protein [Methanoregulaceae archaeon]|nr:VTT domain-containing protein [Methanoregulaceae archaeon]HPD75718.1 VTT domain-containing protein [Methanoregulaceae archaeon]HRY74726.1 VTT domain-containing protein [Methanoregulaceae archaeon]
MVINIIDIFLHIDENLKPVIQEYGVWTYLILFVIIFLETGLVITPFLPGDSLLFVAGACAASGLLEFPYLLLVFALASIVGDTVNYWIGNYIGLKVLQCRFPNILKKEYIDRTYGFYEQYGGLTIFVARFVPIVRTFAPFLAGVGSMEYRRFLTFNILGGVAWSLALVSAGYFFGSIPIVKENLNILIYLVILITAATVFMILASLVSAYLKQRRCADAGTPDTGTPGEK